MEQQIFVAAVVLSLAVGFIIASIMFLVVRLSSRLTKTGEMLERTDETLKSLTLKLTHLGELVRHRREDVELPDPSLQRSRVPPELDLASLISTSPVEDDCMMSDASKSFRGDTGENSMLSGFVSSTCDAVDGRKISPPINKRRRNVRYQDRRQREVRRDTTDWHSQDDTGPPDNLSSEEAEDTDEKGGAPRVMNIHVYGHNTQIGDFNQMQTHIPNSGIETGPMRYCMFGDTHPTQDTCGVGDTFPVQETCEPGPYTPGSMRCCAFSDIQTVHDARGFGDTLHVQETCMPGPYIPCM